MLKKTIIYGFLIFQCAIVKAQFDVNKIATKKIDPDALASENLKLALDFYLLQTENDSLINLAHHLQDEQNFLSNKLKFIYIRDEINQQTFGFLKDGNVLPDFKKIITLKKDNTGKIEQILVTNNDYDKSQFVSTLFTPTSEMAIYAPALYKALTTKTVIYNYDYEVITQISIKRSKYPYLVSVKGSVKEKKKYGALLLNFIERIGIEIPNNRNFYSTYIALEKQNVPNGELDKVIAYRKEFLTKFKPIYEENLRLLTKD